MIILGYLIFPIIYMIMSKRSSNNDDTFMSTISDIISDVNEVQLTCLLF